MQQYNVQLRRAGLFPAMERNRATSFATQANALLRKNLIYQKRKMATNCCLIGFPIILCTLLVLFQVIINQLLNGPSHSCGCTCISTNVTSGTCKKQCGIEYSTPAQAVFCEIPKPPHWPAVMQVPLPQYRAIDEHISEFPGLPDPSCRLWGTCPVSFLYTGNNQLVANDMMSGLISSSLPSNISDLLRTLSELVPGTFYGIPASNFLEPAFYSGRQVYILQPSCASVLYPYVNCLETLLLWRDNYTSINKELYGGYRSGNPNNIINEVSAAFDFGNTSPTKLDVTIWYNDTLRNPAANKPPGMLRLPRSMNLVAQAFLRLMTGSSAQLPLWFVSEMPKSATTLKLDFSSLLGPLFFMWVIQLLFPVIISTLVYEKQEKLRIMMKMHGLGDGAYWLVTYCFFLMLSLVYMACFMMFGSLIGLKFFKLNSYGIQILFYLVYVNLQISLGFLTSSFFSNVTTATVVGYQYVFGFGLLGAFLFQFFVEDRNFSKGAILLMELLPGFALYRGLYEFSQYSLTGFYKGTKGMLWKNMKDAENGMQQVFVIMVFEWILITPLSFYLDQFFQSKSINYVGETMRRVHENLKGQTMRIQDSYTGAVADKPDVSEERLLVKEILATRMSTWAIVCDELRKVYQGKDGVAAKYAVCGLSIAVPCGQCFGMLGPNGAGKTSSINMMIGLSKPSSGTAYIQGLDIRTYMDQIYLCMGVCPQFDLLWETLTGREHLLFYGRLKNLKEKELDDAVVDALRSVNLLNGDVGDRIVETYSGGMKRRLSVAISLIGDPKLLSSAW